MNRIQRKIGKVSWDGYQVEFQRASEWDWTLSSVFGEPGRGDDRMTMIVKGTNRANDSLRVSVWTTKDSSPIRKKTRALCSTKSNSVFSGISLVPLAVCSDLLFRCWNNSSKLGSSFSGFPTCSALSLDHEDATSSIGDYQLALGRVESSEAHNKDPHSQVSPA